MADRQPNILFILTDQQRHDALSCRPESARLPARTPNFDRLAAAGARFDSCFVQSPLCVPSRVSLATGTYAHVHRTYVNEHPVREDLMTWGEALGTAGYRTVCVGRTHSVNRGFEPRNGDCLQGRDSSATGDGRFGWPHGRDVGRSKYSREEFMDFRIARQAAQVLGELSATDEPFALFVGFFAPHPPYVLPEPYDTMYNPGDMPMPEFNPEELASKPPLQEATHNAYFGELGPQKLRKMVAGYWASVALADDAVGIVLDELDSRPDVAANTMTVSTSDHGDLNAEHGLFSKFLGCYDPEVRVPLLVRYPGKVPEGLVVNDLVESVDIAATIVEAAGADPMPDSNGRSLWPRIRGEHAQPHRRFVVSSTGGWYYGDPGPDRPQGVMLRTDTHKLVFYPSLARGELYDLQSDPQELVNLYDTPECTDVRTALERELLGFVISSDRRPGLEDPRWSTKPM
jgi:arylsulfatase